MDVSGIFKRYKNKIEGDKIFDPIRCKYVHLTPEEQVRQKTIKFLTKRLNVPQNKIIVETSLSSLGVKGSKKRIDIGILDEDDLIMAVVECKAHLGAHQEDAFKQAKNYLLDLYTRYYFVTDGSTFDGYFYDTEKFIKLDTISKYDKWTYYPVSD
jgi:hypothetical protein